MTQTSTTDRQTERLDETARETRDKRLFTPGPLTTSATVKAAMQRDLGSRDREFLAVVQRVRARLLDLAEVRDKDYAAIPMQGSGTFAVESVLGSVIAEGRQLLVLKNGAYGARLAQIARVLRIGCVVREFPEDQPVRAAAVEEALADAPAISHVAVVHCETSTGIINPIAEVAAAARERCVIVDAMSSFGALPTPLVQLGIDYLITSANKCLEGVPGCGLVLARRAALDETAGRARSLSLDLLAQLRGLDETGQFRFTPPTHALLALDRALDELLDEGGISGRGARYAENQRVLMTGMTALGFRPFLPESLHGPIISAFYCPTDPRFRFADFYQLLSDRGFVIYPGKVSRADCFRIGTIGRLFPSDFVALLDAVAAVLGELGLVAPFYQEQK